MLFTSNQVQELLDVIERNHIIYAATNIGTEQLSSYDKMILDRFGIDLDKIKTDFTPFEQSFYFGRLSQTLSKPQASQLDYSDLLKYLKRGQYIPLNKLEQDMLNLGKKRAYSHLKSLGRDISNEVDTIIIEEDKQLRFKKEKIIKEEIQAGIEERKSQSTIAREIGRRTGDWQRNLGRIVDTEYNTIFQEGRLAQIIREKGDNVWIYKDVFPGACFPKEDTEYLTEEGYKKLDDIRGDERVYSFNLETGKGEWANIVSKIEYHHKGEMHWYKNSTIDLMSTPNHKHLVGKRVRGVKEDTYENKLIESSQMRNLIHRDIMYLAAGECEEGYDKEEITICGKTLKTESFAKFMGWWLSDGHVSFRLKKKDKSSSCSQIVVTQIKEKNFDDILDSFVGMFPDRKTYRTQDRFVCNLDKSYDELVFWFLKLGKAITKYIPKELADLHPKYLKIFINSFASGDGHKEKQTIGEKGKLVGGGVDLYTSSKKLANDLSLVLVKCGHNPGISIRNNIGRTSYKKDGRKITTRHLRYIIRVNKRKTTKGINRSFKSIENWEGEVGCLQLDKNFTLFVRRNGKSIWSGNCRHCIRLYLTNGIGSKPRLFRPSELIANGTNIGRKVAEWKAVLDSTHPYCRCTIMEVIDGMVWDEEEKRFDFPKEYERKAERKSKIKVSVGDKEFNV